jgi:phenylacetate-CoA ligase
LVKVYRAMPVAIQNAAISVAGLKWRHDRYGGTFRELLASLQKSEWFERDRIETYQAERLSLVLKHAYESVPYYQRLLRVAGAIPSDIRSLGDLGRLPTLTKETARTAGRELLSTAPLGGLRVYQTSGTTGTPLTIWKTAHADRFQWAVWWRHRARFGLQLGDRFLTFGAKVPSLSSEPRTPIWRTNYAIHQSYLPVSHLGPNVVPAAVDWIGSKRFAFFSGYPSGMYVLARGMLERGLRFSSPPRVVCCGSEELQPWVSETISTAFQAKVTQVYGMGESAAGFAECELGRLHIDFELGIVELLPVAGQPPDSRLRRLVCTGLQNLAFPMLRYEVGDYVQVSDVPCGCGRESVVIESVDGRLEDFVITPDGRHVFGLNQVFKLARQVKESQVVQERSTEVLIRLVPAQGYDGSDEDVLRAELALRLGGSVGIRFQIVESIPRTAGGKLRAVLSSVARAQRATQPPAPGSGA